jgi:protein TonB
MDSDAKAGLVLAIVGHTLLLFGFHLDGGPGLRFLPEPPAEPIRVELVAAAPPPVPRPAPRTPSSPPPPRAAPPPVARPVEAIAPVHVVAPIPLALPVVAEVIPRATAETQSGPAAPPLPEEPVTSQPPARGAEGPVTNLAEAYFRRRVLPEYPREARNAGQAGTVIVRVEIDADGRPARVEIARSSGFPLLDEAAAEAARRSRYFPAIQQGRPVPTETEIPYRFVIETK